MADIVAVSQSIRQEIKPVEFWAQIKSFSFVVMACLYDSMKACGLGDVDAIRDDYVQFMTKQLEQQMQKDIAQIVKEDPSLDQTVMGSANFLQMYCNHHPFVAFILSYANPLTGLPAEWVIVGTQQPTKVCRIAHTGSVDGGHFVARTVDVFDLQKAVQEWTRRQTV